MIKFLKNNHGDTLTTTLLIGGIIFVVTIMVLAGVAIRADDIAQEKALTLVSDFVNTCANEGKITSENYDKFSDSLSSSTSHSYDIEIEVQHLDENIGNKSSWGQSQVIGENKYYSAFTSTIIDSLNSKGYYNMKEGDVIIVTVKNTDNSLSQQIESAYKGGTGKGYSVVNASGSATVKVNGK